MRHLSGIEPRTVLPHLGVSIALLLVRNRCGSNSGDTSLELNHEGFYHLWVYLWYPRYTVEYDLYHRNEDTRLLASV